MIFIAGFLIGATTCTLLSGKDSEPEEKPNICIVVPGRSYSIGEPNRVIVEDVGFSENPFKRTVRYYTPNSKDINSGYIFKMYKDDFCKVVNHIELTKEK